MLVAEEGVLGRSHYSQKNLYVLAYHERSSADRDYLDTKILPRFKKVDVDVVYGPSAGSTGLPLETAPFFRRAY